jgi:hypothetical protein
MEMTMTLYKILDPRWEDGEPWGEEAASPGEALATFYAGTLLEPCPVFEIRETDSEGRGGLITKPVAFVITQGLRRWEAYYDHAANRDCDA